MSVSPLKYKSCTFDNVQGETLTVNVFKKSNNIQLIYAKNQKNILIPLSHITAYSIQPYAITESGVLVTPSHTQNLSKVNPLKILEIFKNTQTMVVSRLSLPKDNIFIALHTSLDKI